MDFGNAALLIATVIGLTTQLKTVAYGTWKDRTNVGIVNGASFGAVFLVGATAWAHEQVVGGVDLAHMSVGSKVLVAFFASGAASAGWEVLGALKNIGYNQPTKAVKPPLPGAVIVRNAPTGAAPMPEFTGDDAGRFGLSPEQAAEHLPSDGG